MADAVIGSAYLQVIPKLSFSKLGSDSKDAGKQAAKGFADAYGKGVDSSKSGLSAKAVMVGTLMADAMKGVASTAVGVARDVMGGAIGGFKEYEQLAGGVETLFKDSSDTVMQYARNAYRTAGVSSNQYMETVTGFSASLLQSLGGDTEAAARYADMAMTDMSDNANKMGTSMESITNAYQGFAKQNYTMLDNLKLGYGGTKEEMQRLLDDASKIAGVEFDIDNYDDVIEAIHVMQESMGIAGTTFEEGQSTIEGSMNAAKAAWDNWLVGIADSNQDLDRLTGELVDTVVVAAGNLVPRVVEIVKSLATRVPQAVMELAPTITSAVTQLLDGVTNGAFSKMVSAVAPYAKRIGDAVQGMMERFQPLAPVVEDIAGKVGGLFMGALRAATGAIENLAPVVSTVAEHALPILSSALGIVGDAFEAAITLMEPVGTFLSETLSAAIDWIGEKLEAFAQFVETCFDGIGSVVEGAASFLQNPFKAIGDLFTGTGKSATDTSKTTQTAFSAMNKGVTNSAKSTQTGVSSSWSAIARSAGTTQSSISGAWSRMSSDTTSKFTKASGDATAQMGTLQSNVDAKTRAAQLAATANFETMRTNLVSKATSAQTETGRQADSIKAAWDKSYTMKVNASADTSKATSTLRSFQNSWNGYNVHGTASISTWGADSSMSWFRNSWNGYNISGYASVSTWGAEQSLRNLINGWSGFTVRGNAVVSSSGGHGGHYTYAKGALVQKHADGFIADRPVRGVDITRHIAGEAGGEAIIPLTNKRYVRPFAETVASFIDGGGGGVTVTGNTFVVRKDSDIDAIGRAINRDAERLRRARL